MHDFRFLNELKNVISQVKAEENLIGRYYNNTSSIMSKLEDLLEYRGSGSNVKAFYLVMTDVLSIVKWIPPLADASLHGDGTNPTEIEDSRNGTKFDFDFSLRNALAGKNFV